MNKDIRKTIRKILFEGHNFSNVWNDFNRDEMMGDAERAATQDIKSSGENFEPIGKNEFEKNLDVDALIADLETQKHIKSAALERIQKQIDQLQKFGRGSLNELSPEVKHSAFQKATDYNERPVDGYQDSPLKYVKRKNQANTFISHINPELKMEAMEIAKMLGEGYESRIEKKAGGHVFEPSIVLYFAKNIERNVNAERVITIVIKENKYTWDSTIFVPENVQRRLANFIKKIQAKEISTPIKQEINDHTKRLDETGLGIGNRDIKNGHAFKTQNLRKKIKELGAERAKETNEEKINEITKKINSLKKELSGLLEENSNVNQDSKIDRPKDSEGQPITLRARVEDLKTGSIGRVIRFGVDDNNTLTVHVSWLTEYGEVAPKSIVYPNKIVVKDYSRVVKEDEIDEDSLRFRHTAGQREKSRKEISLGKHAPNSQAALTDEGIGIGLSVKKGMNVKP